ncbi:putative glycosyl hydrolase [Erysiphe necator]|uniref:Putative glycosyl hydrolase n=1 Tax=Uncinula necator TaxID=52586 RepID=A0A0B1PFV0_UNCNE|nr:putative glycosyl hydrolase [Erysiphe necator]
MLSIPKLLFLFFTSTTLAVENHKKAAPYLLEHNLTNRQHPLPEKQVQSPTYIAFVNALDVLQADYFRIWPGVWPTAIDWTSAVLGTSVAGALRTFSSSLSEVSSPPIAANIINRYFSQLSASFFGQDIFALQQQAFDDMLWVTLEWIESICFIEERSLDYTTSPIGGPWYGQQWKSDFAHRARVFWDLAAHGWNTALCNGGMIWNPRQLPYKNAITNELYISASIAMYLYFPGDNNNSPFQKTISNVPNTNFIHKPQDVKYLNAAIEAYKWLYAINMTNDDGLFVDGFHISGWNTTFSNNTQCDERNEMVYTYNQGVLLSGQYGLYVATGVRSYLEDGHKLISNVIRATGWDIDNANISSSLSKSNLKPQQDKWYGLGRNGILEEACDASATCSQDSQTFKGIFFHHLTKFCSTLTDPISTPRETTQSPQDIQDWHHNSCQRYGSWIKHNADAALRTLDSQGRFGAWWGVTANSTEYHTIKNNEAPIPSGAIDYRSNGIPQDWNVNNKKRREEYQRHDIVKRDNNDPQARDPNDRGRGRTVETQAGGLNVLRAFLEIVERPQDNFKI